MGLSWVVTLIAFFVLAILLFLAVIEFKLTTLKGFILVPFALWRGTAFIAEPVLGQVVTSGVRILVYAVITGIGTQLFGQILPTDPATELNLQDALTILLASMTIAGLAVSANRIASGIVSGAPQLGLGAAAAPAGIVAGTVLLAGTGAAMAASAAASGVGAAASLAGGARTAYALGSAAEGGSVAGGLGGMARAAGGAATSGLRGAAEQAVSSLRERYATGARAAWTATGGEATSGMTAESPATAGSASAGLGSAAAPPGSRRGPPSGPCGTGRAAVPACGPSSGETRNEVAPHRHALWRYPGAGNALSAGRAALGRANRLGPGAGGELAADGLRLPGARRRRHRRRHPRPIPLDRHALRGRGRSLGRGAGYRTRHARLPALGPAGGVLPRPLHHRGPRLVDRSRGRAPGLARRLRPDHQPRQAHAG